MSRVIISSVQSIYTLLMAWQWCHFLLATDRKQVRPWIV